MTIKGRGGVAPKPEALIAKLRDTGWASGCKIWYVDDQSRVASWPWTYETFLNHMAEPALEDF